jgi:hypothetical protein
MGTNCSQLSYHVHMTHILQTPSPPQHTHTHTHAVPLTSPAPSQAHVPGSTCRCPRMPTYLSTLTGAQPSGSGSAATGRASGSTGSAAACTTAACATAGSRPHARGTWSSPARRCHPSKAPSLRNPARCLRCAPWGQGVAGWSLKGLISSAHPPSLPDCGSTGSGSGLPPSRRSGPTPRSPPTADPGGPVPHLLHQHPLWLFLSAPS